MNSPEKIPSILDDLVATRDSANRPLLQSPRVRGRLNRRAPAQASEQRSLFGEILDWMFAPLLLLWPLSVAITFVVARSIADAPYDRALEDRLRVMAQQVRFVDGVPQLSLPRAPRGISSTDDDGQLYFDLIDASGNVLAGDRDLPSPAADDGAEPGVIKLRQEVYKGAEVRIASMYLDTDRGAEAGKPVLVQVAETQDKRSQLANEIIKGVILPQFLILPLALALVWFGLGRGLEPLKLMQQRIRARRPDDLSPIDPRGVPEEISPLVDAFNDLLGRLGQTISVQRRFIADAAHQMKTPLAGLRTQAELALRESSPADVRRSLEQLVRSSERAAHLISQLLSLTRMENLREQAAHESLDLTALARTVVTEWADEAIRRGIDFGYESDDAPAPIAGHPILLREMFNNLIDNALRYTPPRGCVTVRVRSDSTDVLFEVEDNGPGVAESERDLVFERFYRVLGTEIDGSGLGLSIVREIASQHDATVALHDTQPDADPPGLQCIVRFPKLHEL